VPILLASEVMDLSAASLNDVDKTTYTYDVQIPYLKLALQELQEIYELNSLPVTENSSAVIQMNAGQTKIRFNVVSGPRLPDNLIEPLTLWERTRDIDPFIMMRRMPFIPHDLAGSPTAFYIWWVWQNNEIKFMQTIGDNDIKIDYVGSLFPKYVNSNTIIPVINAQNFFAYRTAALIKDLIEKDDAGAAKLNTFASLAMDNISGITIKNKQSIVARRRPFRAGYKRIGWF
jgi:hypothetical protein